MKERPGIVQTIAQSIKWRHIRIISALALVVSIVAPFPFLETGVSAFSQAWRAGRYSLLKLNSPQEVLPPTPQRIYAQRINISAGRTSEVISAESISSAIVIDTDIATAEIKGDRSVLITGLMRGSTILIISGKNSRITYAIDVERPLVVKRPKTDEERQAEHPESSSGSSSFFFTPGLNGGPSLLRHNFEYSQKLRNNRTLRVSSEMFHFFGGGDRALTLPLGTSFGANRLKLGLDSPTTRLDLLDSELEISRLGFNGYTLRGPHFVSTSDSRWRGLEFFAGNARPQLTLFNQGEGRLAGAIVPIMQSKSLRVRSGIIFIAPSHKIAGSAGPNSAGNEKGGLVLQTDGRYSTDERTNAEGEVAYGNGGISWRGRLDLWRGPIRFYAEHSHLDRRSPMIAIGAQAGGRTSSAFNLQWQPSARFNAMVGYDRSTSVPFVGSGRLNLNSRTFLFSANFSPTRSASLGFSFNQQLIEAPASTSFLTLAPLLLNLQTRSVVIKYDQVINRRWTNNLEARLILSREANIDAQMSRGISVREQLRYTWRRGSVTGFANFRSNAPSLESLILSNPALLPLEFRAAFSADPQHFLLTNRDALPLLLNGIELPLTSNRESGIRIQSAFSRLNVTGDVVYSVGRFMKSEQRTLSTTLSANLRLDAANSLQVGVSRGLAFNGTASHTGLAVSYVHRFGAASGGGFQFSKLLGIGRGRIQGRAFMDLNGNGQEDPGENGLAGMKIQLDGSKSVITDAHGDFNFGSLEPGDFDVALLSDLLGVTMRASRATLQHVVLSPHQTINLRFGLTNSGSLVGRIFNDLLLTGEATAGEAPGLGGVKVILHPAETTALTMPGRKPLIQFANGNGGYEFRNLAPGNYILEIERVTVPADFRLPLQMSWPITVAPLHDFYLDLPFAAQRAVSGIAYIDQDGDGQFDPRKDLIVEGARVVAGKSEALTARQGSYLLRNLPAGKIEIYVYLPTGRATGPIRIELSDEPTLRTGINLAIKK